MTEKERIAKILEAFDQALRAPDAPAPITCGDVMEFVLGLVVVALSLWLCWTQLKRIYLELFPASRGGGPVA